VLPRALAFSLALPRFACPPGAGLDDGHILRPDVKSSPSMAAATPSDPAMSVPDRPVRPMQGWTRMAENPADEESHAAVLSRQFEIVGNDGSAAVVRGFNQRPAGKAQVRNRFP
jgi:hypothetical protein